MYKVDENGVPYDKYCYRTKSVVDLEYTSVATKEPFKVKVGLSNSSYIDEDGQEIIPTETNSYKFEAFIFDAFEFFDGDNCNLYMSKFCLSCSFLLF